MPIDCTSVTSRALKPLSRSGSIVGSCVVTTVASFFTTSCTFFSAASSPPVLKAFTTSVAACTASFAAGAKSSPMAIAAPSVADLKSVILPLRLSSCVPAICAAEPVLSVIVCWRLSHVSPVFASKELTAARSVLLKIVPIISSFCAAVMPSMLSFKSPKMSFIDRMFPSES